jgi:Bacterial extracellular solute-binding protein
MFKKDYVLAVVSFLLIPAVVVAGGMLINFIDPEIAAGYPNYERNFRLLDLAKKFSMLAVLLVSMGLWFLTCFFLVKSKQQSYVWLVLAMFGPFGFIILTMLQKLGIYDQVKSKVATVKPSEPVGEVVARGEAEIGFHQVSELIPVKGIQYLGPLPEELQNITVYSGGIHSGTKEAAAAAALIKYLTAPLATPTLKKHGLEPG